jgi:hypothetical protein
MPVLKKQLDKVAYLAGALACGRMYFVEGKSLDEIRAWIEEVKKNPEKSMLDIAIYYASIGRAVFPLQPRSKEALPVRTGAKMRPATPIK